MYGYVFYSVLSYILNNILLFSAFKTNILEFALYNWINHYYFDDSLQRLMAMCSVQYRLRCRYHRAVINWSSSKVIDGVHASRCYLPKMPTGITPPPPPKVSHCPSHLYGPSYSHIRVNISINIWIINLRVYSCTTASKISFEGVVTKPLPQKGFYSWLYPQVYYSYS